MTNAGVLIEASQVSKSFGARRILNELNLTVQKGETLVIIGRSGCGKSVFLKHVIGLVRPDDGTIRIDGTDLSTLRMKEMNAMRMRFGMLFQNSALFDSMTVGENVAFSLREHTRLGEKEIAAKVEEALGFVGLKGIEAMRPSEISGGMKKRVALARAVCMRPQILLYDEPTTGLDPITSDVINDLIISLHDKLKVTSIAVTHDMASAYKIATRIAMMHEGKILEIGTPDGIKNSKNPIVRQFITGSSSGPITDGMLTAPRPAKGN